MISTHSYSRQPLGADRVAEANPPSLGGAQLFPVMARYRDGAFLHAVRSVPIQAVAPLACPIRHDAHPVHKGSNA